MSGFSDLRGLVTFRPLERDVECAYRPSPFKASWVKTVNLLADELRHHGAEAAVMEVAFRDKDLRLDGLPRADAKQLSPAIVLSFTATAVIGEPNLRYEVGTFAFWQQNVRAVALALEALRAVDRYGVTKRGEQYKGWIALEAGNVSRGRDLIKEHGSSTAALKATHPDHGGAREDFDAVQAARRSPVPA